jgi:hypothetical protein
MTRLVGQLAGVLVLVPADGAGASDPVTGVLLQYGALGVLAALAVAAVRVLFKRLTAAVEREQQRADRLEEELRKLNELIRGELIKSIGDATKAVADALTAVRRS